MAKATHSNTFPASGDSFSIANINAEFRSLHQGDFETLRPRAHAVPDMGIMIMGTDQQGYYRQVYASGDYALNVPSGDVSFSAPVSNPRIDLIYVSGDAYRKKTGSEAASPAIPSIPTTDGIIPVALVYHRTTEVKIVNYEDTGSNPNEGYLYRDIRPFIGGTTSASARRGTFTSGDLAIGVLTLTHNKNLSAPYPIAIALFRNSGDMVIPDSVTGAANTVAVDIVSFVPSGINGNWGYQY